MTVVTQLARAIVAAAFVLALGASRPLLAQELSNPNPNANSIAFAKELLQLKGASEVFDKTVANVVDQTKDTLLPTNPTLSRPLNEVSVQLKAEFEPKKSELLNEMSRAYARYFTEAELRELLAFYKTNLGRKVLVTEAQAVEATFKRAQDWTLALADQVMARYRAEMKKKGYDL